MVAKKYWSALMAIAFLAAAPSVAMADDTDAPPAEEEQPQAVDEESSADDVAEDTDDDSESADTDDAADDDETIDDPPVEPEDTVDSDDEMDDPSAADADEDSGADESGEPDEEPTSYPEDSTPLDVDSDDADDDANDNAESVSDAPREAVADTDRDPGPGGIATIHADPATEVNVLGNLDDGDRWSLAIGGYMRTAYTWIQADPDHELFGRNDGFQILDARLITRAEMDNGLGALFSLDAGSRLVRTDPDSPVEELAMRMADAYVYYSPIDYVEFNAGQFKAPFDAEDLISSADLLFVHRSVANRGVRDVEGFNVRGLSQSRQIGVQARGTVPFGDEDDDGPAVSYALAAANGNGPNVSMNENDNLAYYGRAAFHWGEWVSVGGAAFHNDRTFGEPPNQVDRETRGWTADVQAHVEGVSLFANVVSETRSVPDLEQDPETTGLGYQVQLAYEEPTFGIQPAYRFAYYDPTHRHGGDEEDDFFEHDAQFHHTVGLNYNAHDYPLRLMANYTFALQEEEGRPLDNDRLDLLLQLQW